MSAIYEVTSPETVKSLLSKVHESAIALPHFQRSYVWSLEKTRSLIVSMMHGYPAGAMLAIRLDSANRGLMFKVRSIESAPPLTKRKQYALVLDGQQRLTSLYHAFYGVGEYRHYLDINRLRQDRGDIERALVSMRVSMKRDMALINYYSSIEGQVEKLMMPLSILQKGAAAFGRWYMKVIQERPREEASELESLFESIEQEVITPLLDYEFPWVVLKSNTPDDAIASVFDVINNTGQRLSVFDLVVARTWKAGEATIQDKWQEALETVDDTESLLDDFNVDPVYALNVCALLSTPLRNSVATKDPACGRGEILKLKKQVIDKYWEDSVWGLNRALTLLAANGGLLAKKWLPYDPVLIPMAAVLAVHRFSKGGQKQAMITEHVMQWYWCTCLSGAYDQGAIAQAARDYRQMLEWIGGGDRPRTVEEFSVPDLEERLYSITPKNGAVYKALICMICRNQPLDFLNRQPITSAMVNKLKIDDHHIFPKAFLGNSRSKQELINSILNRTLIDARSNKELGKTAPSKYFKKMKDACTPAKYKKVIESHLIASECQKHLLKDDFEAFVKVRAQAIMSQVLEVTQ